MPKGIANKRYTGEFKQEVVETMLREKLSYKETARLYDISGHERVRQWGDFTLRKVRKDCT